MSTFKRVQQWATFARVWHLYDARWQNPYESAELIKQYLSGRWKPIFHPLSDCGDHVVVINTRHIALPGDDWYRRAYFHHRTYPGTKTWTLAWELHEKDDTLIIYKAVYAALGGIYPRATRMKRLHLFSEDQVPSDILSNVTNQIRQLRPPPTPLGSIPKDEVDKFPQVIDYTKDYIKGKRYTEVEPERKSVPTSYK